MKNDVSEIPFNRPFLSGNELPLIKEALDARRLSGPGPFSQRCEALINSIAGGLRTLLVPSCTAALDMSALLLDLQAGDEVIVPSYTFVSTANAVVHRGAVPVFVDVDPVTFNIDPDQVLDAITPRTKAIYVVHYAGVPADMTRLMDIAKTYGLAIIEDAAQALGSAIGDRKAGSMGVASAFSFHATKNIIAGEAGALTVNDPDFVERAQVIRDKGTNRSQFLAGKVDLYTWQDIGSSQVVNEVTAAFLAAQLEAMAAIQAERMVLWHRYHNALRSAEAEGHFALPAPPDHVTHNGHIFFVVPHTKAARQSLEAYLAERRIRSATHYVPLHSSPGGRRFGRSSGPMNGTERGAEQLLRLPLFVELGIAQDRVIDAVLDWCREQRPRH